MPELPEVETIKNGLKGRIVGKIITDLSFDSNKTFQGEPQEVIGQKVIGLERRAKILRIKLENYKNLLFHLKMTGQLIFIASDKKRLAGGHPSHDWHDKLPNKHTRITFTFDDDSRLFFNDLRKFGWCKVLTDEEIREIFEDYGPEPFSKGFTSEYLLERAKKIPQRNLKQFLMDQKIIAGIGNIYNDESLFLAELMPTTKVGALTLTDWQTIVDSVKNVLELGIKYGGTTDSDYVNAEGRKGGMQEHLNVYHRADQPCPKGCKGLVEKMTIGGRGTFYCRLCQKEKK